MPPRLLLSSAVIALMLALPAIAPGAASAQTMQTAPSATSNATSNATSTSKPNGAQQLSKQDREFLKDAAIGGMAEVELGKLAQQNAQDDKVKQFGARMVQDHGQANDELKTIAGNQGIDLPQQLDKKHEQLKDRLAGLKGPQFDRAYMAAMVRDHNADLAAFRREAQSGRDPAIKQFAEKTLHVIGAHDRMAKDVDHSLTASGTSRAPR
jgi:putative membrane protein